MTGKHLQLEDFHPNNRKLLIEKPDSNFSRARNYAVINQVLAENDKEQVKAHKQVRDNAGNVADILASFAKYKLDSSDGGKQLEQWLGKSWMTKIYGEKLVEKIRMREVLQRQNLNNGNTLYGGNFYLK